MVRVQDNAIRIDISYQFAVNARNIAVNRIESDIQSIKRVYQASVSAIHSVIQSSRDKVASEYHAGINQAADYRIKLSTAYISGIRSSRDKLACVLLGIDADTLATVRNIGSLAAKSAAVRKVATKKAQSIAVPASGINIDAGLLKKALDRCKPILQGRSHWPILNNVLLHKIDDDTLQLTVSNLEQWFTVSVPAAGNIPDCTINLKSLIDITKSCKDIINIDFAEDKAVINLGNRNVSLETLPAEEFRTIELASDTEYHTAKGILPAIDAVKLAMSKDESRAILAGINLMPGKLAATDTHRLHVANYVTDYEFEPEIIPMQFVNNLRKLLSASDDTIVNFAIRPAIKRIDSERGEVFEHSNYIAVKGDDCLLVSRLIEGQFPDFERIIPMQCDYEWIGNPAVLKQAVTDLLPIAKENANRLMFTFADNKVTLSAESSDIGNSSIDISLQSTTVPAGYKIVFNALYMLDTINSLTDKTSETIRFEYRGNTDPSVVRNDRLYDRLVLVMPMHVR